MTHTELNLRLDRILSECREILALADKSTRAPWVVYETDGANTKFAASARTITPALAQATITAIAGLRDVLKVQQSMATTGKDFFIDGAQRAFPLLTNAVEALTTIAESWKTDI